MNNDDVFLEFLSDPKGLLIAPAGHGKTYSIAQMVNSVEADKPQLILTHTHAGIASLKKKFQQRGISSKKYSIETICGFIQRYVLSLCKSTDIPHQEDENFFPKLAENAVHLFSKPAVRRIVTQSYSHIYVDEYQDCTLDQHKIIMLMSEELPTHLLGDPLQGIFDFAQPIVDFEKDLLAFKRYDFLQIPWRWKNVGSEALGELILDMRKSLLSGADINLTKNTGSGCFIHHVHHLKRTDFFIQELRSFLNSKSRNCNSILVVFPSYKEGKLLRGTIYDRCSVKAQIDVRNEFTLIEAIDDPLYYKTAGALDNLIESLQGADKPYEEIQGVLKLLSFNKTDIESWISDKKVVSKRDAREKLLSENLCKICRVLIENPSHRTLASLVSMLKQDLKLRPKRADVVLSILLCLKEANENATSVLEEMKKQKNRIRQVGRRIEGRCIGTTLLTKGLEFDTVVLIEADKMKSSKDFYVAISRACKEVHIFTTSPTLHFDK